MLDLKLRHLVKQQVIIYHLIQVFLSEQMLVIITIYLLTFFFKNSLNVIAFKNMGLANHCPGQWLWKPKVACLHWFQHHFDF